MDVVKVKKLEGRHVLYMLLGFFGVMCAVNAVFVYFALTSFSGLSVEDSYLRGLRYNDEIAASKDQSSREWSSDLYFEGLGDKKAIVSVRLTDRSGKPLTGLVAQLNIRRPTQEGQDRQLTMMPTQEEFQSELEFPFSGQWDLIILVTGGGYETPYRLEKRVWVK